jgi:TRAP-type C4-dicarboxylate transport system permease small subunit
VTAMAVAAGVLMVGMFATTMIDVVLRNLGFQSSAHFFTFTEYALLFVPMLGSPWLVREKGHVYVEILIGKLSPRVHKRALQVIGVVSIAVCLVLAWYGFDVAWHNFWAGDKDVRTLDLPRWALVVCIPLGFFMMAIEFARLLRRGESIYPESAFARAKSEM